MKDDMTPQTWRTESEAVDVHAHGSRLWKAAFAAQLTEDLMDDVTAYAAQRARWIERQSGRRDPGLVEELVQDAVTDVWSGKVRWNPAKCPLALFLKGVIRGRLSHELEHAAKFPHVAIEDCVEAEVSSSLVAAATPSSGESIERHADELEARIRAEARGDEGVLKLVELYREGITERREVCRIAKMTAATYHNAVRRLKRIVEDVPASLRTEAIAAMA